MAKPKPVPPPPPSTKGAAAIDSYYENWLNTNLKPATYSGTVYPRVKGKTPGEVYKILRTKYSAPDSADYVVLIWAEAALPGVVKQFILTSADFTAIAAGAAANPANYPSVPSNPIAGIEGAVKTFTEAIGNWRLWASLGWGTLGLLLFIIGIVLLFKKPLEGIAGTAIKAGAL